MIFDSHMLANDGAALSIIPYQAILIPPIVLGIFHSITSVPEDTAGTTVRASRFLLLWYIHVFGRL